MNKNFLLLLITTIITSSITAQIGVGPRESMSAGSGNFNKNDLKKLKNSKTVFLYRKEDDLEKLKKAINEVWDYTEISFKPYSEKDNIPVNTSVFNVSSFTAKSDPMQGATLDNKYNYNFKYIKLWLKTKNGKDKDEEKGITYARVELSGFVSEETETHFNYSIGFIKTYLKFINDQLKSGEERWLYKEVDNYTALKELKNKTLYVPEFTFKGSFPKHSVTEQEFDKFYPYDYEVLKTNELSDKIIESKEPIYFFISIINGPGDKFTSIFNSKTGEIIYSEYSKSYKWSVDKKDVKSIGKVIKKAEKKD